MLIWSGDGDDGREADAGPADGCCALRTCPHLCLTDDPCSACAGDGECGWGPDAGDAPAEE